MPIGWPWSAVVPVTIVGGFHDQNTITVWQDAQEPENGNGKEGEIGCHIWGVVWLALTLLGWWYETQDIEWKEKEKDEKGKMWWRGRAEV
jgi:hypothetical protein